ncbi:MAG TPA: hypothetical protein VH596_15315 [Terriglobales bacterium]|jgi:hypothetical protein
MNFKISSCLALALLLLASAAVFGAAPVRKSSQNGTNSSQPNMNLFGPTTAASRDAGNLGVATQIICPNQDVADSRSLDGVTFDFGDVNSLKRSGSCLSGVYKFLFQIQPTTRLRNLTVTISNLVGFTPGTDPNVSVNNPTYGIQVCDNLDPNSGNTLELCTNLPENQLPVVTTAVNAKNTKVVFTVNVIGPNTVPQGPDYTGAGLTFEVVVQQTSGTPITVPKISFN